MINTNNFGIYPNIYTLKMSFGRFIPGHCFR